ncbi:MAG: hypothetical protein KJT01_04535 [Gemmatimonadetes bacterium]|nr:hypothetical protein [Gemmatimonadota bacterium]
MKTTIELPDELYRRVKAKSALEGKTVREVATSLFQQWADGTVARGEVPAPLEARDRAEAWLAEWERMAAALGRDAPGGGLVDQFLRDRR